MRTTTHDPIKLLDQASDLSLELGITVYDALFVALAAKLNTKLVTTDAKLVEKLRGTKLESLIELIS